MSSACRFSRWFSEFFFLGWILFLGFFVRVSPLSSALSGALSSIRDLGFRWFFAPEIRTLRFVQNIYLKFEVFNKNLNLFLKSKLLRLSGNLKRFLLLSRFWTGGWQVKSSVKMNDNMIRIMNMDDAIINISKNIWDIKSRFPYLSRPQSCLRSRYHTDFLRNRIAYIWELHNLLCYKFLIKYGGCKSFLLHTAI